MVKQKRELKATPELEDFAHKYTEEGQGKIGRMLLEKYFQAVAELVQISGVLDKKKAKAIEIGCGEGFSTERLRTILPASVELSASEDVKQLVPRAQKRNPGVVITQESIYETGHKKESFDLIFLLEVLEHLDHPDEALAELARILKKDGVLILGVPREPLWRGLNMARLTYLKAFGNTPGHLNHWSANSLQRFMTANFGPVEAVRTPLPWTLVVAKKSWL